MPVNTNRPLVLSFILFVAFLVVGCARDDSSELEEVTISTSKNVWSALPLIAHEKGFFEAEGLNPKITYQTAGRYNMDALVSGSVDFATVVEVNLAYLGFTGNEDFQIVASVVESDSLAIVGKKSSGISAPNDLRGKTIAYSPGTGGELFAFEYFEKIGIENAEVELRKVQPLALQQSVVGGDIDAASTWEPFVYNISKALGDNAIVFRDPEAYTGYMNLAVRKGWGSKNSETVIKFIKALRRAEEFIANNENEAQDILARVIGVGDDVIEGIWPYFQIGVTLDIDSQVAVTTEVARSIKEDQVDFADKEIPDFSKYFDATYVNAEQ